MQKKAEAEGIRMVADAKSYEIAKAADKLSAYLSLKQLEIQRDLLTKWDGAYPRYFMGNGSASNLLMQLPPVDNATAKTEK
jgi:hypothetical protein